MKGVVTIHSVTFDEIQKARTHVNDMLWEYWIHQNLFTWRWWLLVALITIPWFIWYKIVNKNRYHDVLTYGFIVTISCVILDDLGTPFIWWQYPYQVFQVFTPLQPPNFTLVPCIMMLVHEWTENWKSYLKWLFISSILMTYVGEPIFIWLGLYVLNSWHLWYSFIFYIVVGIIARFVATRHLPEKT
jgi:hypothetical protein